MDRNVCLIVSGAVSAQAAPSVAHFLRQEIGVQELNVIMTQSAKRFVTPHAIAEAAGTMPVCDWDDLFRFGPGGHVRLAVEAHLVLVWPATANFIASLAAGQTYSPALLTAISTEGKVVLIPAMNERMWRNPLVSANVDKLRSAGCDVYEPFAGYSFGDGNTQAGEEAGVDVILREIFVSIGPSA